MKIYIDVPGKENEKSQVAMNIYMNHVNREIGRRFRSAVIVCPGGGYAFRSDTESEAVAVKYQSSGFQAFVLEYSVGNAEFPRALIELAAAVKYIRENADVLDVDSDRIFVCGFSAGGHLAASLATLWNSELMSSFFDNVEAIKPSGVILCYPVITTGQYGHQESIDNISKSMNDEEKQILSLEKQVSADVPPVFIWHTFADDLVPMENTLLFANALRKYDVPFEMHIFPYGKHGLSLATEYTAVSEEHIDEHVARWFELSVEWIREVRKK